MDFDDDVEIITMSSDALKLAVKSKPRKVTSKQVRQDGKFKIKIGIRHKREFTELYVAAPQPFEYKVSGNWTDGYIVEGIAPAGSTVKVYQKYLPIKCDVLIIDEWQNMSSDGLVNTYKKVKRDYTIGLSATPMRKKGQNFYSLEKTIYGVANPNQVFNWRKRHGIMVYDEFAFSKEKWTDFKNYDAYLKGLPNFMTIEECSSIEGAKVNNGHAKNDYLVSYEPANKQLIKMLERYNIVRIGKESVMSKQSFGKKAFMRYLNQSGVKVDFPKLAATNEDTDFLEKIDGFINRLPKDKGMIIVTKSRQIGAIIAERNPHIGYWFGGDKKDTKNRILVATMQTLGTGVDGLQHDYHYMLVCDPIDDDSGEYNDYRQLLWRITGSRQQHDVGIIEMRCNNGNDS